MPSRRKPIWPKPGPVLIFEGSFPIIPPSVNEAYKVVKVPRKKREESLLSPTKRRYVRPSSKQQDDEMVSRIGPSDKLVQFKTEAAAYLRDYQRWYRHKELLEILSSKKVRYKEHKEPLQLYLLVVYPTMWKHDVDGGEKFVQDAVCTHLGINDNTTVRMILDKRPVSEMGGVPRCEISLQWLSEIPPVLNFPRAQGAIA